MKIVQHGKKRKAISPVLATVILIAITLIAAIAVAGFVFGLFGSFTSSALVTASVTNCSATSKSCNVLLINSGTANANVGTVCSMTFGGVSHAGITNTTATITAGGAAVGLLCTVGGSPVQGQALVGQVGISNGGQIQFSGNFGA